MKRPSRLVKRLIAPALLVGTLVGVQVVFAQPPVASFTVSAQGAGGCGTFTFTSTSTDADADITSTEWDLDGDGSFDAGVNGSPVTHTYATPGARSVTMRVTDAAGGDDTTVDTDTAPAQTVNVVNANPPTADIVPSANPVQPNQAVTFSAAGSADAGGGISQYEWDLDGTAGFEQTTTTATATHIYATAGTRTIRVRVTDTCGATAIESASIDVQNPDPTFTIAPNPAQPGDAVTFTATPQASITNYAWDLDGDGTFETDTDGVSSAQMTYASGGTFGIQLQATYSNGAQRTAFRLLTVNFLPEANFTFAPNPPVIGEPVTFQPTGSRDFAGGSITKYEWDLDGNGTYETTGANPPAHVYNTVGTVSVGLRVTDNNNGVTVLHKDVPVQATRPRADLTFSPANPLPGQAVTLTSTSTPSTTAGAPALQGAEWDFDYPVTEEFSRDAIGGSVVTSFATPGPKTVAIKAIDASGGFAIAKATIPVNAPPVASFTVRPTKPLEGREVTFASTSSDPDGPIVKQEWDLDNDAKYERQGGVVSTSSLKRGTRTIRLRVTDSKGATSVAALPVKIGAKPLADPVRIRRSIGFARHTWGIRLVALLIKVPRQTTVTVRCKGRGCPSGTFKKHTRKKAGTLVFDKLKGSLRAGAKITVYTTHPGHVSRFDTYIVRGKSRAPLLREQCKYPGKKRPRACP